MDNFMKQVEVAEDWQSMKSQLLEGIQRIRSLCDEAEAEIKGSETSTPRLCDILAEDIPDLSYALFEVILGRGKALILDFHNALVAGNPQRHTLMTLQR